MDDEQVSRSSRVEAMTSAWMECLVLVCVRSLGSVDDLRLAWKHMIFDLFLPLVGLHLEARPLAESLPALYRTPRMTPSGHRLLGESLDCALYAAVASGQAIARLDKQLGRALETAARDSLADKLGVLWQAALPSETSHDENSDDAASVMYRCQALGAQLQEICTGQVGAGTDSCVMLLR